MERNFCILILCANYLIGAEYIYSARLSSKNHVLTYQDFFISPVMMKSSKNYDTHVCSLKKTNPKKQHEYKYLLDEKQKLFDCFYGEKIKVYGSSTTYFMSANSNTQIFLTPIHFKAICDKKGCEIYK